MAPAACRDKKESIMEWINEKAKTLKQGAIRAMFDRANTMPPFVMMISVFGS